MGIFWPPLRCCYWSALSKDFSWLDLIVFLDSVWDSGVG